MRVTHLQSSTVLIEVQGTKILTDPWLVDGEYYGSWYHYPPFPLSLDMLDYDYIYISHIHPDHMSRKTLEALDRNTPVLIHSYEEKFLKRNIESLGYQVIELEHGAPYRFPNGGEIEIYAADNCDPALCAKFIGCAPVESKFKFTQIDSLCVVTDGTQVVLNTNDCPFELSRAVIDRILARHGQVDLMLVGYAGAGPFPQCFTFADDALRRAAAERKRDQFIAMAARYIEAVNPRAYMPFAGTYVLGGRLGALNDTRGVPDIGDALSLIEDRLAQKGRGFLLNAGQSWDVSRGEASGPYVANDPDALSEFIRTTATAAYDYDADDAPDAAYLREAVMAAYPRFRGKAADIGFQSDTVIVLGDGQGFCMVFGADTVPVMFDLTQIETLPSFVQITVDGRLLARLLKGPRFAHWNNAEIGSHLHYRREPDVFERGLYYAMSAFHA